MCFFVLLISVSVSVLYSHSVCLCDFIKVYIAELQPLGKELLIWLTVCSLCIMSMKDYLDKVDTKVRQDYLSQS